jgi:hypothetical protein
MSLVPFKTEPAAPLGAMSLLDQMVTATAPNDKRQGEQRTDRPRDCSKLFARLFNSMPSTAAQYVALRSGPTSRLRAERAAAEPKQVARGKPLRSAAAPAPR